uniref:Probable alginate O-acetylase AlgI n=2 Tax=Aromatoleum anaerobium TaxID=182180 RepID=A0ABX1PFI2_9RHOO
MLFNSYEFIFFFLPIAFAAFFWIARYSRPLAALWLFAASLFFYGWWNPVYVGLLVGSIFFNFAIGTAISREHRRGAHVRRRLLVWIGVSSDLALLAYYKYANFFVSNANQLLGTAWHTEAILLPLGISFFTFTQIAFLVDAYRGEVKESNFVHYGLFVTYFPHLIAGPVLHHKEMMPQFSLDRTYRLQWDNLSIGLTVFAIGLFKKVVLADGVAPFASPVFSAAANGASITLLEAWCGALAYTLQLYFDFSGYSDMAIGLSRIFGIRLPLNFDSPYKATSIIDFWRRWHMTLSRFLRDYLYFALGGNRKGAVMRHANLMITMLLGGLWHGAGWTFVIWGGLHGIYLVLNHAWRRFRFVVFGTRPAGSIERFVGRFLTFLAVVLGWVFFRASDAGAALSVIGAMAGANGLMIPSNWPGAWYANALLERFGFDPALGVAVNQFDPSGTGPYWIAALLAIAWFMPNTQEFMARFAPTLERPASPQGLPSWSPHAGWAVATGTLGALALLNMSHVSEFLYFQF